MKTNNYGKLLATLLSFVMLFTIFSAIKTQTRSALAETEIYYAEDYSNTGDYTSVYLEERIDFATYTETSNFVSANFPDFHKNDNSLTNACAPVAGSNVLGFYDRWCDNLIPDYTAGMYLGDIFAYYDMSFQVKKKDALIANLYSLMGTNTVNAGTTKSQYTYGLTAYINNAGYSVNYNSVMSGGSFNFNLLKQQIDAGIPVTLFFSGYNFTSIALSQTSKFVVFGKNVYTTNHVIVVCGYMIYNFYDSDGNLIASKTLLHCSSGMPGGLTNYMLNNNGNINDAEGTVIY